MFSVIPKLSFFFKVPTSSTFEIGNKVYKVKDEKLKNSLHSVCVYEENKIAKDKIPV